MHTIDIPLVQRTWEMVLPIADDAAQLFYGKLFELDPSLRRMFSSTDMSARRSPREIRRSLRGAFQTAGSGRHVAWC